MHSAIFHRGRARGAASDKERRVGPLRDLRTVDRKSNAKPEFVLRPLPKACRLLITRQASDGDSNAPTD